MRLIDADALIEKTDCLFKDLNSTEDYMGIGYNHGAGDCIAITKNAPTIEAELNSCEYWDSESRFCALRRPQAEPIKHGRWKPFDLTWGRSVYACTSCETAMEVPTEMGKPIFNYCPNCGAKMEGAEE